MSLQEKLLSIQKELKAPKSQYNSFGKYRYRSCEDILEAVKPLLFKEEVVLTIADDLIAADGRFYVKASATLAYKDERICTSAFAREDEVKKGMDGSQITGAASSYARKYALNGLFCIDDTKDADATNTGEKDELKEALQAISEARTIDDLKAAWSKHQSLQSNETFKQAKDRKKTAISNGL
jgi:hypothetical protein